MRIPSEHSTAIPTIVIGIGAVLVIAALVWLVRNSKKEAFSFDKKRSYNKQKTKKKRYGKKIATIQEEYPYWGWGKHAGLRCARPDNTGCNTGYDSKGRLRRLNQSAYD